LPIPKEGAADSSLPRATTQRRCETSDDTTIVLTRKSHLDPTLPKLLKDFNDSGDLIPAMIRNEVIG